MSNDVRFDGSSTEDVEFLRTRVARIGFGATMFGGAFLAWSLVVILTRPTGGDWSRVFAFNALGVAATATMWTLCRRPERSTRFVKNTEAIGVVTAGAAYVAIGAYTPAFVRPEMMVLLLLTSSTSAGPSTCPARRCGRSRSRPSSACLW